MPLHVSTYPSVSDFQLQSTCIERKVSPEPRQQYPEAGGHTPPPTHLRHGEAQLVQLVFAHQGDGDAVGQHQVAVDDVLDHTVTQATGGDYRRRISIPI